MSKKDKSKFRKRLRAEILKQMSQSQSTQTAPPVTAAVAPTSPPSATQTEVKPMKTSPALAPGAGLQVEASSDTLQLVRHDLKKSAIIIGSIIISIVVLYFVDQKTGILLKAGNEIFKVLHIGA